MFNRAVNILSGSGGSLWESLVSWYENSLLGEIINYLEERYFSVDFGSYENFSLGNDAEGTVRTIILGIAIGLIIAAGMTAFHRTKWGGFVRKLIKNECLSPDKAMSLMELGEFRSTTLRHELSHGINLRRVVKVVEEKEDEQLTETTLENKESAAKKVNEKIDFTKARFYIPEDLKYRAEIRFERKGSGWPLFLGAFVIAILFAALACWLLPELLQMADNLITMLAP